MLAQWQKAAAAGLASVDWQRAATDAMNTWLPQLLPPGTTLPTGPPGTPGSGPPGSGPPGSGPPIATAGDRAAVLAEINARRAGGGVCGGVAKPPAPPVARHAALETAATWHSDDMAARGFVGHQGSDGSWPEDRIVRAGWNRKGPIGEIAAGGYPSPQIVVAEWMDSPGHCRSIMNGSWKYAGVGATQSEYWVVNFGR